MNDLKMYCYKRPQTAGGIYRKNTRRLIYIMLVRVPEASKRKEVLTG